MVGLNLSFLRSRDEREAKAAVLAILSVDRFIARFFEDAEEDAALESDVDLELRGLLFPNRCSMSP